MRRVVAATSIFLLLAPAGLAQAGEAAVPVDFLLGHQVDAGVVEEHNCPVGTCPDGDPSCGSDHITPRDDGEGFTFAETDMGTGCAQARVVLPVPAGSEQLSVAFWADRNITRRTDVLGQEVPVDAVQEVLLYLGGDEAAPARIPVFDPAAGPEERAEHEATFNLGALGARGGEVALAWLFSDQGSLGSQNLPVPDGNVAFSSTVRGITASFEGTLPEAAAPGDVQRTRHDGRQAESFHLEVPLPRYEGAPSLGAINTTVAFDLRAHTVESVTAPGASGGPLPVDVVRTDEDALPARVWITQEFTVVPAGAYGLAVVYNVPPSTSDLAWLPALVLGVPVVAGVLATRNVLLYRRQARGPYLRTSRSLMLVSTVAWALYAVLVAVALAAIGWTRMQVLPPDTEAVLVYGQVAVVLVGFLLIWHLAGRSYVDAMRQDLARRDAQERELRRSNEELERFAYVASHDLQEPLRKVASSTMMIRRRYGDRIDASADKWIDYAVDGAHRMQAMVQSLLTYSRAGKGDLRMEAFDLGVLIDEILDDLDEAVTRRGAEVRHDGLPVVWGDRMRLRQVFQNLIQNALTYHDDGARPEVDVQAARDTGGWTVSVRDNGIGVPPDKHDDILEPFHRLHSSGAYEGTGIGLAICVRIVERHGGRLWIESEENEGSTFHVWLPPRDGGDGS